MKKQKTSISPKIAPGTVVGQIRFSVAPMSDNAGGQIKFSVK